MNEMGLPMIVGGWAGRARNVLGWLLLSLAAVGAVAAVGAAQAQASGTLVRVATNRGPIDIELFDTAAPITVENFLGYVRRGAYDGSFFHRLARGFVIQGGGYKFTDGAAPRLTAVPADSPITNEFSAQRSNLRGTVAMAKLGSSPNSATNQWFVNLANNSANLDNQNGGFTVFGRVTGPGMAVVDSLAALQFVNAAGCTALLGPLASALTDLPLVKPLVPLACETMRNEHLAVMQWAAVLPRADATATDRILNYLEAAYPQYAAPASPRTLTTQGYLYRYYAGTQTYAGTRDGQVYYLVPALGPEITRLGSVDEWLAIAAAAGY